MENYYLDCHSHTNYSPDGEDGVAAMCDRANALGLLAYCVTDHFEANKAVEQKAFEGIKGSMHDLEDYRMAHTASNTAILCGVEIGQPLQALDNAEKILALYQFDYVIGSLHNVENEEDFYWIDYKTASYDYLVYLTNRYYQELYQMTKWGKFDALGHLTYPIRYSAAVGIKVDISVHDELIEQSLKNMIEQGKGIELNTSGLRQPLQETMPNEKYLKMYRQLGGEILTIGSDSHCKEDLAKGIGEGIALAQKVGFQYITYFKNRKPMMIKIG